MDVRNPDEVKTAGKIPGSVNIPLPQLEESLNLSPEEFKDKFGFEKPKENQVIVTHCMKGARAAKAQDIFASKGFENVKSYPGSFSDWQDQGGDIEK